MSEPVAKNGDTIIGLDTHIVLVASVPTAMVCPFEGPLTSGLCDTVFVDNEAAAVAGSGADNVPIHIPIGGPFRTPPANKARIASGSGTVFADNKPLGRANDPATCCNDPVDADTGHVMADGTVFSG